jgi:hypothetical protein
MSWTGYQPMTIAQLGARLSEQANESIKWRLVLEFLEEFRHEPVEIQQSLITDEPVKCGDERFDLLLAALAEHLAYHHGFPASRWTVNPERLWIGVAWFPNNLPSARVWALAHSPAAFRRRGIFLHPEDLFRA